MKVIGSKLGRCDASGLSGEVNIIDPEIGGMEWLRIYLAPDVCDRFVNCCLTSRWWFRLANRLGPDYRLLAGECYSIRGQPLDLDESEAELPGIGEGFPDDAEIIRSPIRAVRVGVIWTDASPLESDVHPEVLWEAVHRNDPQLMLHAMNRVIGRRRQTDEIRDLVYRFAKRYSAPVTPAWLSSQWSQFGHMSLGSLFALAIQHSPWLEVRAQVLDALLRLPPQRVRWEAAAWCDVLREAPFVDRAMLQDRFIERTPTEHRVTVDEMFSRTLRR
ncbi:MAG: hypothetical protein HUU19_04710 [Phycisphaerales bacterium]|nr:hypothetical protein [Phycisphaerales bacterium]